MAAVSVALVLTLGARSATKIYAAGDACAFPYIVSNGDWLSRIAARLLGDAQAYTQIVDATNAQNGADGFVKISDPNLINVDDKLCIPQASNAPAGLELNVLANASYKSDLGENGTVTLQDAVWQQPVGDGSTALEMMVMEDVAYGKLGGADTAAVVTWDSGGGTARFYNLRLMQVKDGALAETATLEIGDRVFIHTIKIANDQIVIDMMQQATGGADCCPTERVVNTYALQDGALKLVSTDK
jgi:hypothetical protein